MFDVATLIAKNSVNKRQSGTLAAIHSVKVFELFEQCILHRDWYGTSRNYFDVNLHQIEGNLKNHE